RPVVALQRHLSARGIDVGLTRARLVVDLRSVLHCGDRAAGGSLAALLAALLEAFAEHQDCGARYVARRLGAHARELDGEAVRAGPLDLRFRDAEWVDAVL